jgi:polysaccharide biosynthesis/export protein
MSIIKLFTTITILVICLQSCVTTKKEQLTILHCGSTSGNYINMPDIKIKKFDIISIAISEPNAKLSELSPCVNGYITESAGGGISTPNEAANFLVDAEGNIYQNCIGKVLAEGKTLIELQNELAEKLKPYIYKLSAPIVQVRIINFKYSVEGEVSLPGTKNVENNRVNILEAIAASGGLKIFAQRDSVVVIRQQSNGKHEYGYINLKNKDIVNSPYFYLQQNDYVYVPPTHKRQVNEDRTFDRYFGIGTSIVGTITSIISLFLILRNN